MGRGTRNFVGRFGEGTGGVQCHVVLMKAYIFQFIVMFILYYIILYYIILYYIISGQAGKNVRECRMLVVCGFVGRAVCGQDSLWAGQFMGRAVCGQGTSVMF